MKINKYLEKVAYVVDSEDSLSEGTREYRSKFDGSYITLVGMEDKIKYLADLEITEELTHGVGFSPKDNKWYGWSHRAIFGFEVGSECKKGMCHYTADNPEELVDDYANFFADISQESADSHREECQILDDKSGMRVLSKPVRLPMVKSIEDLPDAIENPESVEMGEIFTDGFYEVKCGRGEWVAKTMDDAKQMAKDFNEGVS